MKLIALIFLFLFFGIEEAFSVEFNLVKKYEFSWQNQKWKHNGATQYFHTGNRIDSSHSLGLADNKYYPVIRYINKFDNNWKLYRTNIFRKASDYDAWYDAGHFEYLYQDDGLFIEMIKFERNDLYIEKMRTKQLTWYNPDSSLKRIESYYWLEERNKWDPRNLVYYEYGDDGEEIATCYGRWDYEADDWSISCTYRDYKYNSESEIIEQHLVSKSLEGEIYFERKFLYEYEYSNNIKIVYVDGYTLEDDQWVLHDKYIDKYDEYGNKIEEISMTDMKSPGKIQNNEKIIYEYEMITNVESELEIHKSVAYPNPVTDIFSVSLPEDFSGNCQIRLVDLAGRPVKDFGNIPVSAGSLSLSAAGISPGVYFLHVRNGMKIESLKLIKK